MRLARAEERHLPIILDLINDAVDNRLRYLKTDQWEKPWPDEDERDARVLRGLEGGKTWILWDGKQAAATVTIATELNPRVWPESTPGRAVYVHRLITGVGYRGYGLGAELVDWAGRTAARQYGATSIRIDVWKTNLGLHAYYRGIGFEPAGECADREYPSGALFEKPVPELARIAPWPWELPEDSWLTESEQSAT